MPQESSRHAHKYYESIGGIMKTSIRLEADAKALDALAKVLAILEKVSPEPVYPPKAVLGEDNIIFVEIGYKTDEDTFLVGDRMAEVAADLVEETGVTVVLAPFVSAEAKQS
jgi:hypothetical protein